ncbi:hypothetical protein FKP32DRAFT_1606919 [Trametes sanguinea]|nr:hypothetical protein FKP32DRAFT_1606919 [Trametes sanguinea]
MYTDPPHMWQAWFAQNQAKIPTWMDLEIGGQRPTLASLDYHLVVRKAVPRQVPIPERGQWVLLANELFSILGLYERIVQLGNYPVRPYYNIEPYPGNMGDLSIFHLARWYAAIGMTAARAARYVYFARRARNQYYGRMLDDQSPFVTGYNHRNEVQNVPTLNKLGPLPGFGGQQQAAAQAPVPVPAPAPTNHPAVVAPAAAPRIDDEPMAEVVQTPAANTNTPGTGDVVMTAPATTTTAAVEPQAPATTASGGSDNASTPRNDAMED